MTLSSLAHPLHIYWIHCLPPNVLITFLFCLVTRWKQITSKTLQNFPHSSPNLAVIKFQALCLLQNQVQLCIHIFIWVNLLSSSLFEPRGCSPNGVLGIVNPSIHPSFDLFSVKMVLNNLIIIILLMQQKKPQLSPPQLHLGIKPHHDYPQSACISISLSLKKVMGSPSR